MKKQLFAMSMLALAPLVSAEAQVFDLFPTDGGGAWQVSCTVLIGPAQAPCDGTYSNATRVTATPSGWASVPVAGPAGNAYYIAPNASATLRSNTPDEQMNYEYTYRTTVQVEPGATLSQLDLNVFRLDNYFVGWSLNGGAFNTSGLSPEGAHQVNSNYWATPFELSVDGAGFVSGTNTLEIRVRGNGRTDAILAQGTYEVVPEPGTMVLLGSGLLFLGAQVRRRRNA